MTSKSHKAPVTVRCPTCQTMIPWSTDNPHRPFCSERCRNTDFIAWAKETNIIAGNTTYDDLLSDDLSNEPDQY